MGPWESHLKLRSEALYTPATVDLWTPRPGAAQKAPLLSVVVCLLGSNNKSCALLHVRARCELAEACLSVGRARKTVKLCRLPNALGSGLLLPAWTSHMPICACTQFFLGGTLGVGWVGGATSGLLSRLLEVATAQDCN